MKVNDSEHLSSGKITVNSKFNSTLTHCPREPSEQTSTPITYVELWKFPVPEIEGDEQEFINLYKRNYTGNRPPSILWTLDSLLVTGNDSANDL